MRETHKSESTEQNSTFTVDSISPCCIPLERDSGDSHDPLCRSEEWQTLQSWKLFTAGCFGCTENSFDMTPFKQTPSPSDHFSQ